MSLSTPTWLLVLLASMALAACRQQAPAELPPPSGASATQVTPSPDLRGASDHADAPPAIGALTAGQASGGARGGAIQPTAGDGAASAASAPASR